MKTKLIIIILLILTSCSKDCPVDKPTRTELLTTNEWVGVHHKIYMNNVETDYDNISSNTLVFLVNSDYLIYKNGIVENIEKWTFSNEEQVIVLGTLNFQIETLNTTSFVFSREFEEGTDTKKIEYSFKR